MAAKQNILLHQEGVEACDQQDWLKAIAIFQQITPLSATIFFNIGCCYLQLQQYRDAERSFLACIDRDKYLAVGYFQLGVAQTYMEYYQEGIDNFNGCLGAMRGNTFIQYKQLNLACKIFASEVRLNIALLYLFSGESDLAMQELQQAAELEAKSNNFVHTALVAIVDQKWDVFGQTPTEKLVQLNSNAVFRPSKAKLDGIRSDPNFKKSAKVVSATNDEYSFVGFVGPVKLQRDNDRPVDRPLTPSTPSISVNTPPLPSVAPPRRIKPPPSHPPPAHPSAIQRNSVPINIPSPPSSSPPPLRKSRPASPNVLKTLDLAKAISEKFSPAKLSPVLPRAFPRNKPPTPPVNSNIVKPKPRPPPPSKNNLNLNFQCNLTTSLSISKPSIKSYNDFTNAVAEKLIKMAEEVKSGRSSLVLEQSGKDTAVNSNSWKDVFLQAAKDKKLHLVVKESNLQPKPKATNLTFSKPLYVDDSFDDEDDEEGVYVDATFKGSYNDDNIYHDAKPVEDDNEIYSQTVY